MKTPKLKRFLSRSPAALACRPARQTAPAPCGGLRGDGSWEKREEAAFQNCLSGKGTSSRLCPLFNCLSRRSLAPALKPQGRHGQGPGRCHEDGFQRCGPAAKPARGSPGTPSPGTPNSQPLPLWVLIKSLWHVLGSSFSILASVSATNQKLALSCFFFFSIASLLLLTFLISDIIFNLLFNLGLELQSLWTVFLLWQLWQLCEDYACSMYSPNSS